jgi:hypothetical protein
MIPAGPGPAGLARGASAWNSTTLSLPPRPEAGVQQTVQPFRPVSHRDFEACVHCRFTRGFRKERGWRRAATRPSLFCDHGQCTHVPF